MFLFGLQALMVQVKAEYELIHSRAATEQIIQNTGKLYFTKGTQ